jgi:hypothetical protein
MVSSSSMLCLRPSKIKRIKLKAPSPCSRATAKLRSAVPRATVAKTPNASARGEEDRRRRQQNPSPKFGPLTLLDGFLQPVAKPQAHALVKRPRANRLFQPAKVKLAPEADRRERFLSRSEPRGLRALSLAVSQNSPAKAARPVPAYPRPLRDGYKGSPR